MFRIRSTIMLAVAVVVIAGLSIPFTMAQATDAGASTPSQVRKAQRKAARAKNKAELSTLEKNGYQPGDDQTNYPHNIQDAERKAGAAKAASTP